MKLNEYESQALEEKIELADVKLENLAQSIHQIGLPAGQELLRRLEMLRIEEKALKRNFEESKARGEPDSVRMAKIIALLDHIETEEESVGKDAQFLNQAAPSSMGLAVEAASKMADIYLKGLKIVMGGHHPLGSSVFVNHTHENLTDDYGLEEGKHVEKSS